MITLNKKKNRYIKLSEDPITNVDKLKTIDDGIIFLNNKYYEIMHEILKSTDIYKPNFLLSDEIGYLIANHNKLVLNKIFEHDEIIKSFKRHPNTEKLVKHVEDTFNIDYEYSKLNSDIEDLTKNIIYGFNPDYDYCKIIRKIIYLTKTDIYNESRKINNHKVNMFITLEKMKEILSVKFNDIASSFKLKLYDTQKTFPHPSKNYESPYYDKNSKPIISNVQKVSLQIEEDMTCLKSKTCDIDAFKKYITYKNYALDCEYGETYRNKLFLKYKWYAYIDKQRAYENLINRIIETYGGDKPIILIYGDWSMKCHLKNSKPTPMISLKRQLHTRFKMYNIDEFRTSKLHNETNEPCENLELPDKNGKSRKIHSVLTYKNDRRLSCINRDYNSTKNMKALTSKCLNDEPRPEIFTRGIQIKKATNPKKRKIVASCNGAID